MTVELSDKARKAAQAAIKALEDRSGFDYWYGEIDDEIKVEIIDDIALEIDKAYEA